MNLINSEHPLLLAESDPWREDKWDSGVLESMADEAYDIMKENNGVGLAMNQVGVDCASFIIDNEYYSSRMLIRSSGEYANPFERGKYIIFCNPSWVDQHRGISRKAEGCLSLDGKYKVSRSKRIRANWYNTRGNLCTAWMSGDLARVFQHECDHTKGLLISNKGKVIK